jgi:hypothetical protein
MPADNVARILPRFAAIRHRRLDLIGSLVHDRAILLGLLFALFSRRPGIRLKSFGAMFDTFGEIRL